MIKKNYKKDFPIFEQNKDLIYLDSAATSQKPTMVLDAIHEYYTNYNANVRRGLYPLAEKATRKVEDVRRKVAQFIHASGPSEILFVRNTTEAMNLVMNGFGYVQAGYEDVICATIMEHHSNFVPWQYLARDGYSQFLVVDIEEDGRLNLSDLYKKIKKAKLLAITHVSNVLGTINPIKEIIQNVRDLNSEITIVLDAAQSVPHMTVDVQELDCDFLAFSGHKLMAATGIGVLYGKTSILEQMNPFLFGSDMIRNVTIEETTFDDPPGKFEAGTPDIAGIISLGAAIDYINSIGMDTIRAHESEIMKYALEQMKQIEGLQMYGPQDLQHKTGVISFSLEKIHPHDIAQVLGDLGICIRAGHHCAMPLHKRLGISASARVSIALYNDLSDIDRFIEGVKKVKKIFSE